MWTVGPWEGAAVPDTVHPPRRPPHPDPPLTPVRADTMQHLETPKSRLPSMRIRSGEV